MTNSDEVLNKDDKKADDENIDYKDKYIRLLAEFENYKKRIAKEKEELINPEQIILDILYIVDDFDRVIKNKFDETGVLLVYKKLKDFLKKYHIQEIDCENNVFDDNYHECVSVEETDDEALKGKIISVLSKGYIYNNKVIKHSKVILGK